MGVSHFPSSRSIHGNHGNRPALHKDSGEEVFFFSDTVVSAQSAFPPAAGHMVSTSAASLQLRLG